jgi:hypothetical protein
VLVLDPRPGELRVLEFEGLEFPGHAIEPKDTGDIRYLAAGEWLEGQTDTTWMSRRRASHSEAMTF